MCGLVGMAGDLTFKHRDVMKTLLFFNTLRGKDSTGLAAYNMRRNTIETRKMTCPGYDFINMPWIDSLLTSVEGLWLGHGRHKTVGEVNRMNAHPFEVRTADDKISMVGAHNGTLSNKYDIQKCLDGEEFGTDSEALINLIAKVGLKDALKEATGAWALTFWDATDDSINFVRNDQRPLYYTYTKDRKVLLWASEAWMLRTAAWRHGLDLMESPSGKTEAIYELTPDTHLKWVLPDFSTKAKPEDRCFADPEREGGMVGKPEKRFPNYTGNYGAQYGEDWYNSLGSGGQVGKDSKQKSSASNSQEGKAEGKEGESPTPGPDQVIGFEGEVVGRVLFNMLLDNGCDWCGDPLTRNASVAWLDDSNICCMKCLRGEHFIVDVHNGTIKEKILSIVKGGRK